MSALVDLDLNCSPPPPDPATTEEFRRAMLCQEQPFPDQGLHKVYGSFWKQTNGAPSSLHSSHEHKLMSLGESGSPNPHVSSNFNKRKTQSDVTEQNLDVRSTIRRKSDVGVHDVIDMEKPVPSDDAVEIVACSGFGYPANHICRSQDGSCCISPENSSLAESGPLCRKPISSHVSPGSVGSSETPDCQSPIKTSNTESRYSLIDLNEPQEKSLDAFCMSSQETYSPLLHSSSPYAGEFSKSSRQVFQKECDSSIGSFKESSITVIVPSSVADNSRNTTATSSVQRQGLIDLNVPLESVDMPSEVISTCQDKDANNDGSKGTVSYHFHSNMHRFQAETPWGHMFARNNNILARKGENNVLLQTSATDVINKAQSEVLIPETLVGNRVHQRLGASHDGESNPQNTVRKLQAEAGCSDKTIASAAETLLSIFSHYSVCFADCPGRSSQPAPQDGNDQPHCSLDSFEKIVLDLEEIKDDGQSIPVIPTGKDGPACGIKLKRGRGMRNFQREIIPGLVSLARQEICDDLHAIGYEPKKTRSRKTRRAQGASSTRSRARKRGSAARK